MDVYWSDHLGFVEDAKEGAPLLRQCSEALLLHFLHHVDDARPV